VAIESLRGLLKTASANGYRTGLVTTDDVTKAAALFYDIPGDASTVASTLINSTKFDFLAGGGRSYFVSNKIPGSKRTDDFDASAVLRQAGGTAFLNAEAAENTETDIKGKTIVLQADETLSYSIDQDPEREAGFSQMAGLATQTLSGDGNAPFVLVIHNNSLARAIAAKDTPAVLEEFRTLDGIVSDVMGMRAEQENADNFGIVLLASGGSMTPKFTSDVAADRSNAVFVVSQLPLSFSGAGAALTGANEERLTQFTTEEYKGWKLSNETRAAILAGTMTPEAAIRASYEPVIAIGYENTDVKPTIYSLGVDTSAGLANALTAIVSTPAK
jgi:alkaline phosphatase